MGFSYVRSHYAHTNHLRRTPSILCRLNLIARKYLMRLTYRDTLHVLSVPKTSSCYKNSYSGQIFFFGAELTKSYGADESKWDWGHEAQVRFPHPLASIPLIGQQFVIAPFPQNGSAGSLSTVNRGSNVSMRFIADLSNWDNSQQGVALGVSGLPSSPHWKDQLEDWRNVTPRAFPFTSAAVASATKETWTLMPQK